MIQQAMVQGQVVVAGEFAIPGPQEEEITEAEKIATSSMGGRKGKGENRKRGEKRTARLPWCWRARQPARPPAPHPKCIRIDLTPRSHGGALAPSGLCLVGALSSAGRQARKDDMAAKRGSAWPDESHSAVGGEGLEKARGREREE
ncbi:hypothetical protein AXG93_2815s1060 [Marchantia polymorpha subsp. ruderalis]|uniref:Uncharacterized protein n=1 Tax=Marchantia polymorpha subsp. ruderalis TaxID=1480154 RepID=A0A176WGR8_MARPO|nr:hypothetical protein AXG93_2815s1060 [Marchantia polymorpha subsp. ruderalis]